MKNQSGFTLIELMIVVAIIGILASIALPAYQTYTKKSHVLEGVNLANGTKTAVWDYWTANGNFPTNNVSAGVSENITGNAVKSIVVDERNIIITYNSKVIDDTTLILQADDSQEGSLRWDCSSGTIANKYRPTTCR